MVFIDLTKTSCIKPNFNFVHFQNKSEQKPHYSSDEPLTSA